MKRVDIDALAGTFKVVEVGTGKTAYGRETCTVVCERCGATREHPRHRFFNEPPVCACSTKRKSGPGSVGWKGHGPIGASWWSHWVAKARKPRARGRFLTVTITHEQAAALLEKQGGRCAFTGEPLTFAPRKSRRMASRQTASLDRIDSSKGYELGNVQWVHKTVNIAKQALTDAEYVEWCRRVVEHRLSQNGTPRQTGTEEPVDNWSI